MLHEEPASVSENDDVLDLNPAMIVKDSKPMPAPTPAPAAAATHAEPDLHLGPEAEAAAAQALHDLVNRLAAEKYTAVRAGGPTIEDLVREALRPMLKEWLDAHLPAVVERLVQSEIQRVITKATG
jgi:cell pole-organizing protein PopZ